MSDSTGCLVWIVICVVIVAICAGLSAGVASLKGPGDAISLARSEGFTNIHVTGKDIWFIEIRGCGHDDIVLYHLRATNPRGQDVSLTACEGLLKGATLRGT